MESGVAAMLYRHAFRYCPIGLVAVADAVVVATNIAAQKALGTDAVGKEFASLIPPADGAGVQRLLDGAQTSATFGKRFVQRLPPCGGVELFAVMPGGHESKVAQLEEVNRLKTQLLNTAAHELNTPLTPIRLQLHLLSSEACGALSPKQRRAVEVLARNSARLGHLVGDILDVARLDSGRLPLRMEEVDLETLVGDAIASYQEAARNMGITMRQEGEAPTIHADPTRLAQILHNLISNAIKFTPTGGTVTVRTIPEQDCTYVEVKDTGIGLTPTQQNDLFQPFSRVHDVEASAIPGTGLGLYIWRGIAQQMGGNLLVESRGRGHGTTFRLAIPITTGSVAPPQLAPESLEGRLRQRI